MHGFSGGGGERRRNNCQVVRRRHMLPLPVNSTSSVAAAAAPAPAPSPSSPPFSSSPSHFSLKDGRKVFVGDCALFKPPRDSPPFIGIIRKLTAGKEDSFSLGVNWLYRPSDVKLGKGISLEAAPNEVFYSFHKDEIPAASLLHPCKVAFLRKGVELPSGISSFVCRRVYDIENKCLWWLTDKDYINERQEEVDKLLDKTRLEMHGAVPSGGHSPKPLNSLASTAQLKPSSDSVQNSTSFSSQVKAKKREQVDQAPDPAKRERLSRAEEGESGQSRSEHMLKSELAKITSKGGLVDMEGVEKFVQLMQPDSADKKIDLAGRIMLVDVIAVTDRIDCLGRFVQLRGLTVLDEWLQEVHKGKIGDGNSLKESEKSVDDFLLALLRALDKLPVNLHALQTCNVGKSVNHLRTHKNSEIQKKARSLVDTWKKQVEAEMNLNDAKYGSNRAVSWPTKPAASEVSHVGNRKAGVSPEGGIRSPTTQSSASKISQVKLGAVEVVAKSSSSPGSMKITNMSDGGNLKDPNFRMLVGSGSSDIPLTPIKEEKSSSSSQSQNNSQSCSSDHAKTVGSLCREDARSSTAGSVTVSKSSSSASRHRKSSNGVRGSAVSGQMEIVLGKFGSSNANITSEKTSPAVVQHDKLPDMPITDHGNNQRLIVRLPNTVRSPSRIANGGPVEDSAVISGRVSPPAEKNDNHDRRVKVRTEALQSNIISSVSSDLIHGKDGSGGTDEGDEQKNASEDGQKVMEVSNSPGSLSGVLPRSGTFFDPSLSSINALVESCVKISEASESESPEDDIGMNLLASVAAGEVLKSENASPSASPQRNSPVAEESCFGNDGKLKHTGAEVSEAQCQPNVEIGASVALDQCKSADLLQSKNEFRHTSASVLKKLTGDSKVTSVVCEDKKGGNSVVLNSSSNLQQVAEVPGMRSDVKSEELTSNVYVASLSSRGKNEGNSEAKGINLSHEHRKVVSQKNRVLTSSDSKLKVETPIFDDDKKIDHVDERCFDGSATVVSEFAATSAKVEKEAKEKTAYSSFEIGGQKNNAVDKKSGMLIEQKLSSMKEVCEDPFYRKGEDASLSSASDNFLCAKPIAETLDETKAEVHKEQNVRPTVGLGSSALDHNGECNKDNSERREAPSASVSLVESQKFPAVENKSCEKPSGPPLDAVESEGMDERFASGANASVSVAGSGLAVKLDFDLNEGITVDDGNQAESVKSAGPGISSAVHLPCPLPMPLSSVSGSFSTSVTVAAAAKGPFVPPESPLRTKGELGWKGSAATSAFRPAEPRKNLDIPVNAGENPSVDTATSRHGRAPLDFDLNVADELVVEDIASQSCARASCSESGPRELSAGVLDFDLNRVDESPDTGIHSVSNKSRFDIPELPSRPSLPVGLSNGSLNSSRDFDLNNGPSLDEVGSEAASRSYPVKGSLPFSSPVTGVRMNGTEFGNFSSWFPPANPYSAITVPSILPGRGEPSYVAASGSQRILAPNSCTTFGPEMYRGPVLSSSPAVPFPPTNPFPYTGFPFDTSFPLSSNAFSGGSTAYVDSSSVGQLCFPTIQSQLVGPAGVVSSPYRPYVMSTPGGPSNAGSDNRKWGGQLDLNAGPGGSDTERRDDRLPLSIRQHTVPSSQSLAEEQLKLYQSAGGVPSGFFKRKEPDGGWDAADRFSYKQSSWQ